MNFLMANHNHNHNHNRLLRGVMWWRRWSEREWTIAAAGFAVFLLICSLISYFSTKDSEPSHPSFHSSPGDWIPLTFVGNAQQKGAFCLDGSLPAYHLDRGFGSGSDNWVLHIEGGGWCNNVESCSDRQKTPLGSSKYMTEVQFFGILSRDPSQNPDFFNWNRVKIRYCDGASFAGHPDSEFKNGTNMFFRGQLIWEALMDELLSIGMSNAKKALLSGCSAGGLATLLHCDAFREILPNTVETVKCLPDAGFFLNEKDIAGHQTIDSFYHDVVHLQGVAKSLCKDCTGRMEPYKCFFPHEFLKSIKTPVFLVNPAYDFWQIQNILVPASSDPNGSWFNCKRNIHDCTPGQIEVLHGFQNSLLEALGEFQQKGGMFINSCFVHCQTWMTATWHSPNSPRINNKTIAESVGDWYFNREEVRLIDCPYPCNPTCYNMDFN